MGWWGYEIDVECGGKKATVCCKRPNWDDVYNGYPLYNKGTPYEKDKNADTVFKEVIGNNYDTATFKNACATRVSLALVKSRFDVKKDFVIQKGDFKGKGFIASAKGLKDWLSEPDVWGEAEIIKGKTTLDEVRNKINGRSGVYIILDSANGKKDHATLWVGANNDAIGGRNYVENGGTVYFWELKGFEATRTKRETSIADVIGWYEALPGQKVEYEAICYNRECVEVSYNDLDNVKWAIKIDEKLEEQKDKTGEKITIEMSDDWLGKEIEVIASTKGFDEKNVSQKTIVSRTFKFEPLEIKGESRIIVYDITSNFIDILRKVEKYMHKYWNLIDWGASPWTVWDDILYDNMKKMLPNLSENDFKDILKQDDINELKKKPYKYREFAKMIGKGKPWDLKSNQYSKYKGTGVWISGDSYQYDVPGNVLYGFAGAAAKFPESVLLKMAGLAQKNDDIKDSIKPKYTRDSNYDDPRDQEQIKAGIELYKRAQKEDLNATLIKDVFHKHNKSKSW